MKRLGVLYKEKVLSLPRKSRTLVEPPYLFPKSMEILQDLFGYKLYFENSGRKKRDFIECRSEENAQFLKVMFGAGMKEIYVPNDDVYLSSILPEFVNIKSKVDSILNDYFESLMNRQDRERLKYEVYNEITKY